MEILVNGGGTPNGFGVGVQENLLHILSPCCTTELTFVERKSPDGLSGVPGASGCIACTACLIQWAGYRDHTTNAEARAKGWLEIWTGLRNVEIEVKY